MLRPCVEPIGWAESVYDVADLVTYDGVYAAECGASELVRQAHFARLTMLDEGDAEPSRLREVAVLSEDKECIERDSAQSIFSLGQSYSSKPKDGAFISHCAQSCRRCRWR